MFTQELITQDLIIPSGIIIILYSSDACIHDLI